MIMLFHIIQIIHFSHSLTPINAAISAVFHFNHFAVVLALHPVSNRTFSTAYFAIYCVVVSRRVHRIASFLRLAD